MSNWRDLIILHGAEGARIAFERACERIIRWKVRPAEVVAIRADPGDDGIDFYSGDASKGAVDAYQCKFFEKIGPAQQAQIRDSYDQAESSKNFQISSWNLCLPVNLSPKENRWFTDWAKNKSRTVRVISPSELIDWSREAKIYEEIFNHDIRVKLDEILAATNARITDSRRRIIHAEEACYSILLDLVKRHVDALGEKYFHETCSALGTHFAAASTGDKEAVCAYINSAFVSPALTEDQKVWLFTMVRDLTGEPIAMVFLRRYQLLLDMLDSQEAKEISTTSLYKLWKSLKSDALSNFRDRASW